MLRSGASPEIEATQKMLEEGSYALFPTQVIAWEDEAAVLACIYRALVRAAPNFEREPLHISDSRCGKASQRIL
jgi:hypothetical protein